MAQQILQHAPPSVALELTTATSWQGYIAFGGNYPINSGPVAIGWVDPLHLRGQGCGTIAINLKHGEARSESVATFPLRTDLGSAGSDRSFLLVPAEAAFDRPSHVEVAKGGVATSTLSGGAI